jgi:3'(2'), 5'-bisphosphate nucleotidase
MNMDTSALLQRAIEIAVAAGRQILGYYAQDLAVESKEDNSPLTAADRAAHEVICAGLRDLSPRLPVWSEESADITWETRRGWRDFWLVDPLDGTREFLKRNGEFTVNIALVSNHCPLLGVVHAPALGRDYWGSPNGAFRRDAGREPLPIRVAAPGPSSDAWGRTYSSR